MKTVRKTIYETMGLSYDEIEIRSIQTSTMIIELCSEHDFVHFRDNSIAFCIAQMLNARIYPH
jgi:hypothetical protein